MNRKRLLVSGKGLPFWSGLAAILISLLPMFLLGSEFYTSFHDQLDGEVTSYVLRARHPGASFFPEFMGGQSGNALIPASYGTLAFYAILSPAIAFMINYAFVQTAAFIGLFFLLRSLNINSLISEMSQKCNSGEKPESMVLQTVKNNASAF